MTRLGFCFSPKILNTKVRRNQWVCGEWIFLACVGGSLNSSVSHGNSTNAYRAEHSLHMHQKIAFTFFSCLLLCRTEISCLPLHSSQFVATFTLLQVRYRHMEMNLECVSCCFSFSGLRRNGKGTCPSSGCCWSLSFLEGKDNSSSLLLMVCNSS